MPTIAIGLKEELVSPDILERIKSVAPGYDILISRDKDEIGEKLQSIEIAVGSFPRDLLATAPKLRWFQQWGAGADWLLRYPEVAKRDLTITNTSGIHPIQITEHVFATLLAFARQLPKSYAAQKQGEWIKFANNDLFELDGKTMLIVGVGAIGERTAKLAKAFGMRVVGMKRNVEEEVQDVEKMVKPDALHDVLPEADVIVLTIPLTTDTKNFIGQQELELMKDDACLINIGRGGTIDEDALLEVLKEGKLSGVGLDVFEEEPLPESSALWRQERVLVTPHYAGLSPRYDERAFEIFFENLERYVKGQDLTHVVDKELGY